MTTNEKNILPEAILYKQSNNKLVLPQHAEYLKEYLDTRDKIFKFIKLGPYQDKFYRMVEHTLSIAEKRYKCSYTCKKCNDYETKTHNPHNYSFYHKKSEQWVYRVIDNYLNNNKFYDNKYNRYSNHDYRNMIQCKVTDCECHTTI